MKQGRGQGYVLQFIVLFACNTGCDEENKRVMTCSQYICVIDREREREKLPIQTGGGSINEFVVVTLVRVAVIVGVGSDVFACSEVARAFHSYDYKL